MFPLGKLVLRPIYPLLEIGRGCCYKQIAMYSSLFYNLSRDPKGPATRNDIVNDIVDDPLSTMDFNVAKIASALASSTISLTKSLRVAGP